MTQPDVYDLFAEDECDADPTMPVVELTDSDLGPIATVTWPHLRGTGHVVPGADPYGRAFPERVYATRLADLIREHIPTAEVWWHSGSPYMAVRQSTHDLVAMPGDTLVIAAGEVTRIPTERTAP